MSDGAPVAGWYADPTGDHAERWWDGAAWTAHTRPTAATDPPAREPLTADDPDLTRPQAAVRAEADPVASQPTEAMAPIAHVPSPRSEEPVAAGSRTEGGTGAGEARRPRRGAFLGGMLLGGLLVAAAGAAFVAVDEGWFERHPTAAVGAPVTDLAADGAETPLRLDVQRTGEHLVAVDTAGSLGTVVIADDDGQRLGEGEGEAQARLTAGTRYWIFLEGTSGDVDVTVRLLR